ncbi:MAG: hypothetical protein Q9195_004952 [Heterodermia aff. obscurata]
MVDPVNLTAAVLSITTAAIESVKFLYTTIGDIKDVLIALRNIRSDLQAVKPVLQKLLTELKREESKAFWTEWADRAKVSIFEQRTIKVFKKRLNDCKSTLNIVLNTFLVIRNEINEKSKRNLEQLFEEMQEKKAFNELFRKICEKAFLKTKNVHNGIEQKIKNIRADNHSKVVAELINTDGEVRNIKQNISNTDAKEESFASAGIFYDLNLSISNPKNE